MTSLKTSIKTITYLSDIGCLEIQGASLILLIRIFSARLIIPAVGVFLPVSSLWMGFHMLTENESWTVLLVLILIDWIKS
ncbi:hypothetical protein GYE81_004673 [Salmonella enterica subsp. enterica serovar Virchow]|nr:hypothetical protein [Salmonella enterica subsp. enterica serovar Virchow]